MVDIKFNAIQCDSIVRTCFHATTNQWLQTIHVIIGRTMSRKTVQIDHFNPYSAWILYFFSLFSFESGFLSLFITWFIFILPSSPYSCPSQNKNNEKSEHLLPFIVCKRNGIWVCQTGIQYVCICVWVLYEINRQQNYASWRARFEIEIQTKSTSPTPSSRTVQNMQWILFTRSLIIDVCVCVCFLCK